ncbi:hypothetical protein ACVIIW_006859 [Bradyrhizobium sp. USDA 4449]
MTDEFKALSELPHLLGSMEISEGTTASFSELSCTCAQLAPPADGPGV